MVSVSTYIYRVIWIKDHLLIHYNDYKIRWSQKQARLLVWELPCHIFPQGGTHIWKWCTGATKHLRCICSGLSVTNCIKKGGLSVTKRTEIGGLSGNASKNRAFRAKMAKNFSTFCQICQKFRKIQFFLPKIATYLTIKCENEGSLSDKDVSGSFGDKEFVKNRGSLGQSWQKWGSFSESERKK